MKYILTEDITTKVKHILSERFILTEASQMDVFKNLCTEVPKKLATLPQVIQDIKKFLNTFNTEITKINNSLHQVTDDGEDLSNLLKMANPAQANLNTETAKYKNSFIALLEAIDDLIVALNAGKRVYTKPTTTAGQTIINTLDDICKEAANNNPANIRQKLKSFINATEYQDVQEIIKLLTKDWVADLTGLETACNDCLSWVDSTDPEKTQKLKEYFNFTALDSLFNAASNDASLREYVNRIDDLNVAIDEFINWTNKSFPATFLSKISAGLADPDFLKDTTNLITKIVNSLDDFENLSALTVLAQQAEETKAENDLQQTLADSQKIDWAEEYKKCTTDKDFNKFWNGNPLKPSSTAPLDAGYFKAEWGNKSEDIKKFGTDFIDDLHKLGFNSITNYFVKFLKRAEIFPLIGSKFTATEYSILHNAVAQDVLEPKDLSGSESSDFGALNIIFNPSLYNASWQDLKAYLLAQHKLKTDAYKLQGEAKVEYDKGIGGKQRVLTNIMLKSGNTVNFSTPLTYPHDLRPITEVNQLLTQLTGSGIKVKTQATDVTIQNIIKKLSNNAKTAQKMLRWLTDFFRMNYPDELDAANNKANDKIYSNYNNTSVIPSHTEVETFESWLDYKHVNYTKKQIRTLLDELSTVAQYI